MTKTKLGLYIGLVTFCCVLSADLACAQALFWTPAQKYDDGVDSSIAVHASGLILEFHQSHALGSRDIWYHVGMLNSILVTWGGSQFMGEEGSWPTVAISKEGYVIVVWSSGMVKSGSDLRYRVGKINPYGGINQSITWLHYGEWDLGFHSSIAINDNGVIVGVHETGHSSTGMYYRVGHLTDPAAGNYAITWDSGSSGIHYDDGINPHIALNNLNQVVEVHQVSDERLLHYHRGTVSGGTINFAASQRYHNNSNRPAVTLLDSGLVVELHSGEGITSMTGRLSPSNPALIDNFVDSGKISGADHGTYPAIATDGFSLLATMEYYTDITGKLFYSAAGVP